MELETRRGNSAIIPSRSVKEDLLPYLNCRLQYRYRNGSALPYANPDRFWYGLFIHGTLEAAYRFWKTEMDEGRTPPAFPCWPCWKPEARGDAPPSRLEAHDIGGFANKVESDLRKQGVRPRPLNPQARGRAYDRVGAMVNALGPHMFPLIREGEGVERKVSAARRTPDGDRYELVGVLDALARASRIPSMDGNIIREYVKAECPDIKMGDELIFEYKGTRRPCRCGSLWKNDELQVQAYAWLRGETGKLPAAGVVIYVNELKKQSPTKAELDKAIRVVPISRESADGAIAEIDDVARQIKDALANESAGGGIIGTWQPNCRDESFCRDCDFLHFCPKPAGESDGYIPKAPTAP